MKIGQIRIGKLYIYRGPEVERCEWARNPSTLHDRIKELAYDPSVFVRISLAHRGDLAYDVIQLLLDDINVNVRFAVLNNGSIKISEEQLKEIVDDRKEEEFIRIKANELLPDELKLDEFSKDIYIPSVFLPINKSALKARIYGL